MNTKPKKQRADDQTVLSFSCPKKLKAALARAAKDEDRNISNFICHHLKRAINEVNPEYLEDENASIAFQIEAVERGAKFMRQTAVKKSKRKAETA